MDQAHTDHILERLSAIERRLQSPILDVDFINRISDGNQSANQLVLMDIFRIMWQRKFLILGICIFVTALSVLYALSKPNIYRAEAILAPVDDSSAPRIGGQLAGLTALAGINLGGGQTSKEVIALKLLESWGFLDEFISKNNLAAEIYAAKSWDQKSNKLIFDERVFDVNKQEWKSDPTNPDKNFKPTSWELYETILGFVSIKQDKETGLIYLAFEHYSPVLASEWTTLLVRDVNDYMKEQGIQEARKNIAFLEQKIVETSMSEVKSMLFRLLEEQTNRLMLASVSDEYALKTINPPKIPEIKARPKRAVIVILGTILGAGLACIVVVGFGIFDLKKRARSKLEESKKIESNNK